MKKKIIALLLTAATVVSLTACGKPFTCDICGEEKTGKKYETTVYGEKVVYCEDCKEVMDEVSSWFK